MPWACGFKRFDIDTTMEDRMGRKGTGVEVRCKAIRIQFSLNGEVVRRTLKRDGASLPARPSATLHQSPSQAPLVGKFAGVAAAGPQAQ
ncbi:MAG TPA: hypothetical protein PLA97_03060 [Rubrivivax sp.]|nr:hypothetical protein [Rubrivivax sp.]